MGYTMEELVLGCLTHDIGKFLQRAYGQLSQVTQEPLDLESTLCPTDRGAYTHKHVLFTSAFFDMMQHANLAFPRGINSRSVEDIARFHHKPDASPTPAASWMCALADRYSAGMDRRADEDNGNVSSSRTSYRKIPIQCIFDEVVLDRTALGVPKRHAYRLESLDAEDSIALIPGPWPVERLDTDLPHRYQELWQQFWIEFERLSSMDIQISAALYEESLLGLLERYTWAIPSSTISAPDISLYDHSRTTAAVAAALYRYHARLGQLEDVEKVKDEREKKFRFLAGDLSGIQDTLFTLRTQGVKGVNKILRARSFLLGAIGEAASLLVVEALQLPQSSVVQQAGGRFLVLVPALENLDEVVDGLRKKFDAWLIEKYTGSLALNLVLSAPFAGPAFHAKGLGEVLAGLGQAIEEGKHRPLSHCSQGVLRREFPYDEVCMACGVRPGVIPEAAGFRCPACHDEFLMGKRLIHAELLAWGRNLPRKWEPVDILGLKLAVLVKPPEEPIDGVFSFRRTRLTTMPIPWAVKSLANHIPLFQDDYEGQNPRYQWIREADLECAGGDPKSFMHIASEALEPAPDGSFRGKPFLGLLKADVDYLGFIFAHGLRRQKGEDRLTLSRVAQLSRMVDLYFTGYLKGLLHREFPNTYTVYAGGDDLLLIGPWRQTLDLASRINDTFRDYTGNNPNITLSAGVTLLKPHYPVNRAVREAETYLDQSKEQGRNRICVSFDRPVPWDRYIKRLQDAEWIHQQLQGESGVSTGFLYRLFEIVRDAEATELQGDVRKAGWLARLAYHLARNIPGRTKEEKREKMVEWLEHLGLDDQLRRTKDRLSIIDWRLPLSIALYRNRS